LPRHATILWRLVELPRKPSAERHLPDIGLRQYQTRVGAFNRFLQAKAQTENERELPAAKLVGRRPAAPR